MDELLPRLHAQSTIGDLPAHELALDLETRGEVLATLLERNPGLPGVVVTEGNAVRGVLSRGQYLRLVSRYLGQEVYHPRPIRHMFEAVERLEEPLMVDAATPIQEAVARAAKRPRALLYEPLIVRQGRSVRLVDFPDLLLADSHISSLRNQQMRQILGTVQEGFLLVDGDERVAAEYSDWVKTLFGPIEIAGQSFVRLLALIVGEEKADLGREYLLTLFDPNVMERWVKDINPLKRVEAQVVGGTRHLAFRFVRSLRGGRIDRILVRIEDQSREVELARELEVQEKKTKERVELVFALLSIDPGELASFLASFDTALLFAGRQLSPSVPAEHFPSTLRALGRSLHAVKGEAGLLALTRLAGELHDYEERIERALAAEDPTAERQTLAAQLPGLARQAAEIRATLEQMGRLHQIGGGRGQSAVPANGETLPANGEAQPTAAAPAAESSASLGTKPSRLQSLSRQVEEMASRLGKEARFLSHVQDDAIPPAYRPAVEKALVQFARNSVVHGLETPDERRRLGKPPAGTLQFALRHHPDKGRLELIFQDDGRGLDLERIRRRAEALGLQAIDPATLPGLIFHHGFSTAEEKTHDAGRGIGLDLVKAEVEGLGGQIVAHTREGAYCAFQILLPAPAEMRSA